MLAGNRHALRGVRAESAADCVPGAGLERCAAAAGATERGVRDVRFFGACIHQGVFTPMSR